MSSSSPSHAATLAAPEISLAESQAFCARLTAGKARNFYYGMMLTPQPRRSAMYAIYTWMRAVDDLADAPLSEVDAETKRRQLETFRRQTHAAVQSKDTWYAFPEPSPFTAMWPAVAQAFREHRVPLDYLDAMIDGQLLDQTRTRYETFDQLYDYCYKVASVVGLTCIQVWGYEGSAATRKLAEERGIALQLTNILRDLVEDAQRDRVYLPLEDLARFGFDAQSFRQFLLAASSPDGPMPTGFAHERARFDDLMSFELQRARGYYQRTATLESFITRSCRPTCWAMMKIYEALLSKMERNPSVVLTNRVGLSKWQKLWIACRATFRRGLRGG